MNKHQNIESLVNKSFDPISKKVNNISDKLFPTRKIGNHKISEHTISIMKELLNKSERNKIEYGSMLCVNPNKKDMKIELNKICVGEKCTLKILPLCNKESNIIIGSYHTHPSITQNFEYDSNFPSITDIMSALKTDAAHILCIGSVENKKISCFTRKLNISYRGFKKNIIHDIIIELEKLVETEKTTKDNVIYHKKMDEIILKYYNKTEL